MELKLDVKKGQKFDAGRVINLARCDCEKCDFLNCPKNNYAVRREVHKYITKDFLEEHGAELGESKIIPRDLLEEFIGDCFKFPKKLYWNLNYDATLVQLITISRSGNEVLKGTVNVNTGEIWDLDLNVGQRALAERISKGLLEIYAYMRCSDDAE